MWLFDWLFGGNKAELAQLRNDKRQLESLNVDLKNQLAISAGREGELRQKLSDSERERGYQKTQLVNADGSLRIANATIESQQELLTARQVKLQEAQEQIRILEYKKTIAEDAFEAEHALAVQLKQQVAGLNTKFISPYSQDIPGLLATMLKGDSAQELSVANKTLLAFNLTKAIHAWRMSGQVVQHEERDVTEVLSQLQTAFPGSRILPWTAHEGVWIYPPKDGLYRLLKDRASLQVILDSGFGVLMPYIGEIFDCDDFAQELHRHGDFWWLINSLMYAESYRMQHAYVVVPLATEVVVVEAETNLIMSLGEAKAAGYLTSDIYP